MTRPSLSLGRRLTYLALALLGAGLALLAYTKIGTADIGDHVRNYTFASSDCQEDDQHAEDPINVVFFDDAAAVNLDYYFDLYHGWGDNGGETQYFKMWSNCYEMDGQPSSNRGHRDRYHARYHRGLDAIGEVEDDPTWGDYSVAAAHFEDWIVGDGCGLGNHAVPDDGFNQGRDNVIQNWVIEPDPGHTLWGYEDWGNTRGRIQCNGEVAASDGYVAFIQVYLDSDGDGIDDADEVNMYGTDPLNPDTDGDGCTEGEEIPPGAGPSTPGANGGFDPLAWYDFFDVPVPAQPDPTPNGPRNKVVDIGDALAVLFYAFAEQTGVCGDNPNGNGVDYDCVEGSCVVEGIEKGIGDPEGYCYDRTTSPLPNPPNDAGPPNGTIDISDALVALSQFGLDCRGGEPEDLDRPDSGQGETLSSAPNAMAVDVFPGGGVDSARTVKGAGPFDVDIAITAAKDPYSGYQFALSYDDRVLVLLLTTDVDGDTTVESWAYRRLDGTALDAKVAQQDLDADTAPDGAAGGSALLSGATSATGVIATVRFQCVGSGASPIYLVAPGEGSLDTTTLAQGGAAIDTSVADAWITCSID